MPIKWAFSRLLVLIFQRTKGFEYRLYDFRADKSQAEVFDTVKKGKTVVKAVYRYAIT